MLYLVSATQGPSGAARVEDTVKDFWATRPRRPRRGRKIAGVASGIANRYRIDPVLVRVGFVVAAIYGGAGVLAYLLGWLFLPEQDDQVSPVESLFGKGRSSTSSGFTILLCIAAVPVTGWFFSGSFTGSFSSWTSLLVVGGLMFLLHQSRGNVVPVNPGAAEQAAPPPPQPTMPIYPPPPSYPVYSPQPAATMPFAPPATPPADAPPPMPPEPRVTPPAWDPLGAAPFAWDLPEPATPEPEEPEPPAKRRKPRVATATLGIALMAVAGLAVAANATWGAGGWLSPEHIVGVVLAIIGLGLVAGAFLRAGRGLIALAVPLSVIGMGMTAISPDGYHGFGDLAARPTSVTEVQDVYQRSVGTVELDLTGLPDTGVVNTEVRTGVGSAEVVVPKYADVFITCEADIGSVDCLGRTSDSIDARVDEFTSVGDTPGGLEIYLRVSADTGNVEVRRG